MRWSAATSLPSVALAREPEEPYGPRPDHHEPPSLDLRPYTREELWRLFRGGEREADEAEARLVQASRARGGLWLRIGQGLRALRTGRRLQELAFRFPDYAREIGIGRSRAYELAAFAEALETRPLLREAVRSGRVRYRAAQEVMPVARGDAEPFWVEKAALETVRALEKEVARRTDGHADEPWLRMVTSIDPDHRLVLEEALRVAGRLDPHASPSGRYEAIAQEYLAEFPSEADDLRETPFTAESWRDDGQLLGGSFRLSGLRAEVDDARAATLEAENDAWTHMPPAADLPAPEVDFAAMTSAKEIDRELRRLARQDAGWDAIIGHRAQALRASGIYRTMGYASFRQYVEERLGLPYRAVARRAKLEERIWASEALQAARRLGLGFEKLWMLSFLPEAAIAAAAARAGELTVIALRRELDLAEEAQMRGRGRVKAILPRSVAYVLAAAMATARARAGRALTDGECLAVLAVHFVRTYEAVAKRRLSNSQRVRERDGGLCTVPGCSARADDAHHIHFRSRGGHRTALWNQSSGCRFHHACIHDFGLRLEGRAPDALGWTLDGAPFTGR